MLLFNKAVGLPAFAMGHRGLAHRFGSRVVNWKVCETQGEVRCWRCQAVMKSVRGKPWGDGAY